MAPAPGGDSLPPMIWRRLDTTPIDIDTGIEPSMACAVADALAAHDCHIVRLIEVTFSFFEFPRYLMLIQHQAQSQANSYNARSSENKA